MKNRMEAGGSGFRRCGYVKRIRPTGWRTRWTSLSPLLNQKQMTFEAMWENVTVVLPERANNNLNEEIAFVHRSGWEAL